MTTNDSAVLKPSRPLTVAQVAHRLGCSPRTVRRELDRGKLRGFKVGSDWRVSPEALVEYQSGGLILAD
jgi:excisionase family DNA binding protein